VPRQFGEWNRRPEASRTSCECLQGKGGSAETATQTQTDAPTQIRTGGNLNGLRCLAGEPQRQHFNHQQGRDAIDPTCPRCRELDARIADLERRIAALEPTGDSTSAPPEITDSAVGTAPSGRDVRHKVRHRVRITPEEEEQRRRRKERSKTILSIVIWTIAFAACAYLIWWIILLISPGGVPRN
jgi:hypothetical protein